MNFIKLMAIRVVVYFVIVKTLNFLIEYIFRDLED
tara:strand:- start:305 stop:409 length:105 start_codon:yes stop_codon:yes gene_type:complete